MNPTPYAIYKREGPLTVCKWANRKMLHFSRKVALWFGTPTFTHPESSAYPSNFKKFVSRQSPHPKFSASGFHTERKCIKTFLLQIFPSQFLRSSYVLVSIFLSKKTSTFKVYLSFMHQMFGQITIFPKPKLRPFWGEIPLITKLPFGVTSLSSCLSWRLHLKLPYLEWLPREWLTNHRTHAPWSQTPWELKVKRVGVDAYKDGSI